MPPIKICSVSNIKKVSIHNFICPRNFKAAQCLKHQESINSQHNMYMDFQFFECLKHQESINSQLLYDAGNQGVSVSNIKKVSIHNSARWNSSTMRSVPNVKNASICPL